MKNMEPSGIRMTHYTRQCIRPNFLLWPFQMDTIYRTPALVIETINNLQRRAVVQIAIKNLKDLYPWVVKDSLEQIFIWLFCKHGPWLRDQGLELSFIEHRLNIRLDAAETSHKETNHNRISTRDKMSHAHSLSALHSIIPHISRASVLISFLPFRLLHRLKIIRFG